MAVDKQLLPSDTFVEDGPGMVVDVSGEEETNFELVGHEVQEDGSVIVDFDPEADQPELTHSQNLAEIMDENDLNLMANELVQAYEDDKQTRKPWEDAYTKGLSLLGLQIEERQEPWAGASGVFHPILTEACIKFQAEAMAETFPASGPVMAKIVGKSSPELDKQAKRVKHDMNYYCTEVMEEYQDEHEAALFHLGIGGSIFKKVYQDPSTDTPTIPFIMADDFVVAYGTTNLKKSPRYTHVMKEHRNDVLKSMHSGRYRMVELGETGQIQYSDVDEKEAKVAGAVPRAEKDDRDTLLEMHVDFDIPGFEDKDESGEPTGIALPYIVTIDKQSRTVLSIYRNWSENDPLKRKNEFFVHYRYLPGLGFYGIGLVHLLGGIGKSATSILRQLIDAGTLSNLPAGLKSRGLRIKGDNSPLRPGEFRDVDVPGGAIKDNITFVPYKEPSAVLYQLLGTLVEEGRNIVSIADLKISDMNSQAPVGTTLALLERGMKVMTGIHRRIHSAMKVEFRLLSKLIRDYGSPEYEYPVDEGATRAQDYDDRVDIVPVSNPNASTMAHRVMKHQAIHQLSQTAPNIYNEKELHRSMVTAMGGDDVEKLIPMDDEMKPQDPVSENMSVTTGQPVKAHIHQDHESHIQVHMAFAEDPKIEQMLAKNPAGKAIAAALAAHIQEHVAFQYRRDIEKQLGVPMPKHGEPLPAETEVQLSKVAADAADKLLKKDQAEIQAQKNAQAQQDPVLQIQRLDAETKAREVQRKETADQEKAQLARDQLASKEGLEVMELRHNHDMALIDKQLELAKIQLQLKTLESQEARDILKTTTDMIQDQAQNEIEMERIDSQERISQRQQETARNQAQNQPQNNDEQF